MDTNLHYDIGSDKPVENFVSINKLTIAVMVLDFDYNVIADSKEEILGHVRLGRWCFGLDQVGLLKKFL